MPLPVWRRTSGLPTGLRPLTPPSPPARLCTDLTEVEPKGRGARSTLHLGTDYALVGEGLVGEREGEEQGPGVEAGAAEQGRPS